MKRWSGLLAAGIMALSAVASSAGETEMLVNNLAEKGILSYGEVRRILTEGKEDARKALAMGEVTTLPYWIQNISLKGDLRLRHQIDWDSGKNYARVRERLRLRTGFETRIVDNMKAGFGLATGSERISDKSVSVSTVTGKGSVSGDTIIDNEPSSTNHTFSGFAKPMLLVDYAFIEYTPFGWLKATGGKMKSGTQVWNPTDLLWDTDINPDGLAVTLKKEVTPLVNVFFNGSWLILNDLNAKVNNPDVYIAQPGISVQATDKINVKAAIAWQNFNINGKNAVYYAGSSATTNPDFDYICMNPSIDLSVKEIIGAYSINVYGDMVSNADSKPASDKSGSAYGLRFGDDKLQKFGQWQVSYIQRRLETNAWPGKLGDSDAYGGDTNSQGYEATFTMGLTKSASIGIDYYQMEKITGTAVPKSLIQFDLVYKF